MTRRPLFVIAAVFTSAAAVLTAASVSAQPVDSATRLKDVARLQGVTTTPLIGYGLVIGLNKTGDKRQTIFTTQTLANMLEQFGTSVPAAQLKVENIAAVLVTASLPAYAHVGTRIDLTASAIGDARSLQGGVLMATPLRAPNGQIVAVGEGPLSLGGFAGGNGGNGVQVNHLTVGRVPEGALVHTDVAMKIPASDTIAFSIADPDFTTANQISQVINKELGEGSARVLDSATIQVRVPPVYKAAIPELIARLEPLPVSVDAAARVVIAERTGTVVIGGSVRLGPAAVAHGNLSVKIATRFDVSQPNAFSRNGDTAVVPQQEVEVNEGRSQLMPLEQGSTLDAVIRALNALGASPRDIIAIMQALKAAGALRAELVIL
jgi:flagellar P-ring protein precursor FlgI